MKNTKGILTLIIVVLLIVVAYLLMRDTKSENNNNQVGMEDTVKKEDAEPNYMMPQLPAMLTDEQKAQLTAGKEQHSPKTVTFNVTGGSFFYAPNELTVSEGDTVKIIFTNAGGTHNLVFDNPKIATKTIKTGETDTIEFKAPKKGTYQFYCDVGNGYHRMMGQIGVLLVK